MTCQDLEETESLRVTVAGKNAALHHVVSTIMMPIMIMITVSRLQPTSKAISTRI